jgi:hypothetical protein
MQVAHFIDRRLDAPPEEHDRVANRQFLDLHGCVGLLERIEEQHGKIRPPDGLNEEQQQRAPGSQGALSFPPQRKGQHDQPKPDQADRLHKNQDRANDRLHVKATFRPGGRGLSK